MYNMIHTLYTVSGHLNWDIIKITILSGLLAKHKVFCKLSPSSLKKPEAKPG